VLDIAFIDVQIDAAAMALRQGEQHLQIVVVSGAEREWSTQHAAEQPTGGHRPLRQRPPLGRAPVGQGHQRHQLQLHPARPAAAQVAQGLPAGRRAGPAAVDVGADGAQALAPGALQRPLPPGQHRLAVALIGLPQVGPQGPRQGPLPIGMELAAVGLVEVGVGLHQGGEGQGQGAGRLRGATGTHLRQMPPPQAEVHRHQTVGVRRGKGRRRIQQTAGQAQGREIQNRCGGGADHRRISSALISSL
jgi:hypothetical protein